MGGECFFFTLMLALTAVQEIKVHFQQQNLQV